MGSKTTTSNEGEVGGKERSGEAQQPENERDGELEGNVWAQR